MNRFFSGAGARMVIIGFIALMLMIPMALVSELTRERQNLRQEAIETIAHRWAGRQQVGGPMLFAPLSYSKNLPGGFTTVEENWVLLPAELRVSSELKVETRSYGIYETPVYVAEINMRGQFDRQTLIDLVPPQTVIKWDQVKLMVPLTDVRGLRSLKIEWDGQKLQPSAQTLPSNLGGSAVGTLLPEVSGNGPLEYALSWQLAGTSSLEFLAMGQTTEVSMNAPWPDPSFVGRYLPLEREITETDFSAEWKVLSLNRSFGQAWNAAEQPDLYHASLGVSLYQPADIYQQVQRAGKYGLLFIALTFLALFILDTLVNVRLHPVQYVFVGLALTCFFLALLALAEHIGFGPAYWIAAILLIGMVGGYSSAILKQRRRGVWVAVLLTAIYALIYWLLIAQQYSLLVGAFALLGLLGAAMYVTRNIDWHGSGNDTATAETG